MTTNAQAALQAAATVHAGSKGYTSAQTVTNLAYQFKHWLDRHDAMDEEKKVEESNSVFEDTFGLKPDTPYTPAFPKPGPHSIGQTWLRAPLPPDGTVPGR